MISRALQYIFLSVLLFSAGILFGRDLRLSEAYYEVVAMDDVAQAEQKEIAPAQERGPLDTLTQEDLDLFFEVLKLLDEHYIAPPRFVTKNTEPQETDEEEEGDKTGKEYIVNAIRGLVTTVGDPHTSFLRRKVFDNFSEKIIEGEITGIGIYIGESDGLPIVLAALDGSPAKQAGLHTGDTITEVDGEATDDLSIDEIVELIRGPVGSQVAITYREKGRVQERTVSITRQVINIPSVHYDEIDDVFVIRISGFSRHTAEDFERALDEFQEKGFNKLIIDLQGNSGGLPKVAQRIAGFFIPKGEPVFYEYTGSSRLRKHTSRRRPLETADDIDIVVLIDEGSASTSEILAGALRFYNEATIIGRQSFGKGSVQRIFNLSDGSALKVTQAYWLLPDKTSISEVGITPDIIVSEEEILEARRRARERDVVQIVGIDKDDLFIEKAMQYFKQQQG